MGQRFTAWRRGSKVVGLTASGSKDLGLGFRGYGSELEFQGFCFRALHLRFRALVSRLRFQGSGFRPQCARSRI